MGEGLIRLGEGIQNLAAMMQARKQEQYERQLDALDMAAQEEDRGLLRQEHELRMKQLGLAVEQANFNYQLSLARGAPEEQAAAEREQEFALIQRDAEEFEMKRQKFSLETDALKALTIQRLASADRQSRVGTGGADQPESTYAKRARLAAEGKMKQIRSIEDRIARAELNPKENAEAIEGLYRELSGLEEEYDSLMQDYESEMGYSIPQEDPGGTTAPPPPAAAPQVDLLTRILRGGNPQGGNPTVFQQLSQVPGVSAAGNTLQAMTTPPNRVMDIPGTGQSVTMDKLSPDLIQRMLGAGIVREPQVQQGTINPYLPYQRPQQQQGPGLLQFLFGLGQ